MKRSTTAHFLLFLMFGAGGTVAHYTLMVALANFAGVNSVLAAQAGALLGALVNYGLNRRLNYRDKRSHGQTAPRFALIFVTGFLLNGVVVAILTAAADWHYLAAQLVATAVVLSWGFIGNHFWTFSEGRA